MSIENDIVSNTSLKRSREEPEFARISTNVHSQSENRARNVKILEETEEVVEAHSTTPSYWTDKENEILKTYVTTYQMEHPNKSAINWQPLVNSGKLNRTERQCSGHHQVFLKKENNSKIQINIQQQGYHPAAGVIGDDGWNGKDVTNLVKLSTQHTRKFNGEMTINWVIIGTVLNKPWNVCKMKYDQLVENKSPVLSVPDLQVMLPENKQNKRTRFDDQKFLVKNKKSVDRVWTQEEIAILQEMGPKYMSKYEMTQKPFIKWSDLVKTGLLNRTALECAWKYCRLKHIKEDLNDAEADLRGIDEPSQFV